jgi:hypothetical protein
MRSFNDSYIGLVGLVLFFFIFVHIPGGICGIFCGWMGYCNYGEEAGQVGS